MQIPGVQPAGPGLPVPLEAMGSPAVGGAPMLDEPVIRGELQDWTGGKKIDLSKKTENGGTLREELSAHLKETLDQELQNHNKLVEKLKRYHRIYKAEKRGGRPQEWMADVSIPIARANSDAIYVRVQDMIYNKRKICLMRPKSEVSPEERDKIYLWEKAFNNYLLCDLNLKDKMKFPTRQCVNVGTGVAKIVYEVKNKTVYRYADELERLDTGVRKYKAPGTKTPLVKEEAVVFRGPNVYPVDRADWILSSDALSIEEAYLCGFRFYRRKKQLETLGKKGVYDANEVRELLPSKPTDIQENRATSAGLELTKGKYTEPYELWELWLRYDCDGDGEEDDIVVTFHRDSGRILKAIYNPLFYGFRPFVDFKGASQVEYTYDGEGICELVDVICEEIDTLQNLMLDKMKLAILGYQFYNTGAFNQTDLKLTPGKPIPVDGPPEQAIFFPKLPDTPFSVMPEVQWLVSQADRVCGITPDVMGVSTSERPVAKETFAHLEEANKKFKSWTDNFRAGYRELFYRLLEAFAQYQPSYTFIDENGEEQTIAMPTGNIRDYLEVELETSSEAMNQQIRRETEITLYQLLTDFSTKMAGMAQLLVNPQVPSDLKKFVLQVNDIGVRAMQRILANFDESEPNASIPDMKKVMDTEKCVGQSIDLIQQAQMMQQQAMAQGGQPPGVGTPPAGPMGPPGAPPEAMPMGG